jgi:hypothetical protein
MELFEFYNAGMKMVKKFKSWIRYDYTITKMGKNLKDG